MIHVLGRNDHSMIPDSVWLPNLDRFEISVLCEKSLSCTNLSKYFTNDILLQVISHDRYKTIENCDVINT